MIINGLGLIIFIYIPLNYTFRCCPEDDLTFRKFLLNEEEKTLCSTLHTFRCRNNDGVNDSILCQALL
jgi:hypothetical protein